MISEKRYQRYDLMSHLFLSYMSALVIFASIFSQELAAAVPQFHKIAIVLSLALFTTSIIIYGFRFSDRATAYRHCYLKLQSLEESFDSQPDPASAYDRILAAYPNHAQSDYEDLILNRTLFANRKLQVGDETLTWTWFVLIKRTACLLTFWFVVLGPPLFFTTLFALPFIRAS